MDIVNILVESKAKNKGAYWRKLKERLILEGENEVVTNYHELKMIAADGKKYAINCANLKTMIKN